VGLRPRRCCSRAGRSRQPPVAVRWFLRPEQALGCLRSTAKASPRFLTYFSARSRCSFTSSLVWSSPARESKTVPFSSWYRTTLASVSAPGCPSVAKCFKVCFLFGKWWRKSGEGLSLPVWVRRPSKFLSFRCTLPCGSRCWLKRSRTRVRLVGLRPRRCCSRAGRSRQPPVAVRWFLRPEQALGCLRSTASLRVSASVFKVVSPCERVWWVCLFLVVRNPQGVNPRGVSSKESGSVCVAVQVALVACA
jgi:hypothetical protein